MVVKTRVPFGAPKLDGSFLSVELYRVTRGRMVVTGP